MNPASAPRPLAYPVPRDGFDRQDPAADPRPPARRPRTAAGSPPCGAGPPMQQSENGVQRVSRAQVVREGMFARPLAATRRRSACVRLIRCPRSHIGEPAEKYSGQPERSHATLLPASEATARKSCGPCRRFYASHAAGRRRGGEAPHARGLALRSGGTARSRVGVAEEPARHVAATGATGKRAIFVKLAGDRPSSDPIPESVSRGGILQRSAAIAASRGAGRDCLMAHASAGFRQHQNRRRSPARVRSRSTLAVFSGVLIAVCPGCVALNIPSVRYHDPADHGGLFGPWSDAAGPTPSAAVGVRHESAGAAAEAWRPGAEPLSPPPAGCGPDAPLAAVPEADPDVPWPRFHPLPTRPVFGDTPF